MGGRKRFENMIEGKIYYCSEAGKVNTDKVLDIAKKRSDELGICTIIVASSGGTTAVKAGEIFQGKQVIGVSHYVGFKEPNVFEWPEGHIRRFDELGGIRLTSTHALLGISGAVRKKWNTYIFEELIASTLRLFGHGMKVAVEISMMAADAGLARTDEDAVVIAGTNRGSDTAVVLRPVNLCNFFDLRVKEILCKPCF